MSALAVEGVWKFYGDYAALRNVQLVAERGSCLALIGRNGAGKTTLLRTIAGFSRPGRGRLLISGKEPRENSRAKPSRTRVRPTRPSAETAAAFGSATPINWPKRMRFS